mmetsp:Transcript_26976/g.83055  ORF Transcript_26976/g.83055 Transcript_26976/m.83055 type:complete len:236 (+) Transcript_26976:981-1688(+)
MVRRVDEVRYRIRGDGHVAEVRGREARVVEHVVDPQRPVAVLRRADVRPRRRGPAVHRLERVSQFPVAPAKRSFVKARVVRDADVAAPDVRVRGRRVEVAAHQNGVLRRRRLREDFSHLGELARADLAGVPRDARPVARRRHEVHQRDAERPPRRAVRQPRDRAVPAVLGGQVAAADAGLRRNNQRVPALEEVVVRERAGGVAARDRGAVSRRAAAGLKRGPAPEEAEARRRRAA